MQPGVSALCLWLAGCVAPLAPHDTAQEERCDAIVDAVANRALGCGAYPDVAWAKLQRAREQCAHIVATNPLGESPDACLAEAEGRSCEGADWSFWCSAYVTDRP